MPFQAASLIGDFNNWNAKADVMTRVYCYTLICNMLLNLPSQLIVGLVVKILLESSVILVGYRLCSAIMLFLSGILI